VSNNVANFDEDKSLVSKGESSSEREQLQKLISKSINNLIFDQETTISYVYIAYVLLVFIILFEQVHNFFKL